MATELRQYNQAQQLYLTALTSAYRRSQLYQPSVWLGQEPEIDEKMLRDPDIAHAVGFRCKLVAGRQWTLVPKDANDPLADLAVDIGTKLLGHKLKKFTQSRALLARAFFHGQRWARIHGECVPLTLGDGKRRMWWVPTRLEDVDSRQVRMVPEVDTRTGEIANRYQLWNVGRGDWERDEKNQPRRMTNDDLRQYVVHTYEDEQGSLGFGKGLRDALAWCWRTKAHVFEEAGRAIERFAGGMMLAKVNGLKDGEQSLPNPALMQAVLSAIENARARHSLVIDRDDEIEVVQGSAEGWQMLTDFREALRSMVLTLVLSANLPTSADKGGSFALSETQADSTEATMQYDREALEESLTDSLVRQTWANNYPNLLELGLALPEDNYSSQPRFNIKQEQKLDPEKRANVAKMAHEIGLPLPKAELYEQLGFRQPEEGEDVLDGAEPMQAGFGPGGEGGTTAHAMLDGLFGRERPKPPAPPQPPSQGDEQGEDADEPAKAAV